MFWGIGGMFVNLRLNSYKLHTYSRYIRIAILSLTIGWVALSTACNEADGRLSLSEADLSALMADSTSEYDADPTAEMPDPTAALPRLWSGNYLKDFNDSNYVHWADAERVGIQPLTDTRSHLYTSRPLVRVTSCEDFYVEDLTHSEPYLVPEAAQLLHDIGSRFNGILAANGGARYRIKVTSVLRTPESIRKLRRANRNAIDSSVHQLGTTFDISYARFIPDAPVPAYSAGDLKQALASVLDELRAEGRCYVKHERKQPCFHISARPTH